MMHRDAVAPVPHRPYARRIALAIGITTAVAIAGAVVAISSSSPSRLARRTAQVPATSAVSPHDLRPATAEEVALARHELVTYAFEAYPRWVSENPSLECPRHLLELNAFVPGLHAVDPWGTPYQLTCGKIYGRVLSMRSAGHDRAYDTADDLSTAP